MASGKFKITVVGAPIVWDDVEMPVAYNEYGERGLLLNYDNGSGYAVTAGQVLYEDGTFGQPGYIVIKNLYDITLSQTGILECWAGYHSPTPFVATTVTATVLGSPLTLYIQ